MPQPIAMQHFRATANIANRQGGALDITKSGELVIRGQTRAGRAALWLKDHLIPGRQGARNKRVLKALAKSLIQFIGQTNPKMKADRLKGQVGLQEQKGLTRAEIEQMSDKSLNRVVLDSIAQNRIAYNPGILER